MFGEKLRKRTDITPTTHRTPLARIQEQPELSRVIDDVFDDFRKSFDDIMTPFFPFPPEMEQWTKLPTRYAHIDLVDNGEHYTVTAELPGFNKDQVDVQIDKEG
ncbi:MAG: hypothetical protein GX638_16845, partial [Crenarchaeota archaeon]|nr:hypothetical protein [Thermoproteota archaeon]